MNEIVLLDGGLGNNLFQLHYAWRLKCDGQSSHVLLYQQGSERPEETRFLEAAANALGLGLVTSNTAPSSFQVLVARLGRKLSEKKVFLHERKMLKVTRFPRCRLHVGYWQSIPFIPESKNPFDDALSALLPDQSNDNPILHIRGGDYLTKKNAKVYSLLDFDYYCQAFVELESQMEIKKYDVASNDHAHVNALLSSTNKSYSLLGLGSALDDFISISQHKAIVASNSTFCWWAARLGLYKGQTELVIAPRNWMNRAYRHRSHPQYSEQSSAKVVIV